MAHPDPIQVARIALTPDTDVLLFRQQLSAGGPAVVVVWVPPATSAEIGDVAAVRRMRREFALLDVLSRDQGRTFSREELLRAVGAQNRDVRSVDVHVTWLRDKSESAGSGAPALETVRGVGYRLEFATALTNR